MPDTDRFEKKLYVRSGTDAILGGSVDRPLWLQRIKALSGMRDFVRELAFREPLERSLDFPDRLTIEGELVPVDQYGRESRVLVHRYELDLVGPEARVPKAIDLAEIEFGIVTGRVLMHFSSDRLISCGGIAWGGLQSPVDCVIQANDATTSMPLHLIVSSEFMPSFSRQFKRGIDLVVVADLQRNRSLLVQWMSIKRSSASKGCVAGRNALVLEQLLRDQTLTSIAIGKRLGCGDSAVRKTDAWTQAQTQREGAKADRIKWEKERRGE